MYNKKCAKVMKNVGIKSEKLYKISSIYGLVHDLSLIKREYKSGKCIYILKCIVTYNHKGIHRKKVYRNVYYNRDTALRSLKQSIFDITIENIDFQMDLPF